jgi:tetratricopeptide (TPR) repeat protein
MKKIKVSVLFLMALMAFSVARAQSIEDGKKSLYYEKYKTAASTFQSLVNANPNNTEAVYWLGQTMLRQENKDVAGAKALYQKALATNTNSALLIAGMGHVNLLENNTQDARSQFETAISLSKGKDIAVLNAIGFANGDFDVKAGDAAYAIDKLKQATQIKGFKDPDVWANLGDAYRKIQDGGNAKLSYDAALALDPHYARAPYRIGSIFQSQGQTDLVMQYYNQAIALDPNYTPVYYSLYVMNYQTNVPKSAEYLDKYLNALGASDATDGCYLKASILYAQAKYQETIDKAKECISAGGSNMNPAIYGLPAYAYYKLNDSVNAKLGFDEYFQKQKADKIGIGDYLTYAEILEKFPGNEDLAATYYSKAIDLDPTETGKVATLKTIAKKAEARKDYIRAADWYNKILTVKKDPSKTDLYYAGYNYYLGGKYQEAINIFNTYAQKYADESFGFYMNGKAYAKLDTLNTTTSAISNYLSVINMADAIKDKPGEKDRIKGSYRFAIEYYANTKGNKDSAIYYADKAIAFDPADTDYGFADMRKQLDNMKPGTNRPPATPRPPATTSTTTTTVGKNGEKVTIGTDGTITTVSKDGLTTSIVTKSGKVTTIKNGITTIVENGKITTIDKNGKSTTVAAPATPAKPAGNQQKKR